MSVLGLALAILGGACGSDNGGRDTGRTIGAYAEMYEALCTVEAKSRSGDIEAARDQFFANARDDLHELAATAGQSDRTASARLHEAGYAVEDDFERAPTDLPTDVSTLTIAARAAIVVVGESEPSRCQSIGDT